MTDRLIISIGDWATLQAEGLFALSVALLAYFAALWFAAWWLSFKYPRS
jgi:hypothetical protein